MAEAGAGRETHRLRNPVRPAEAPPPAVAVIDREGMVLAVLAGRVPARAFLRRGAL